MNERIAALIDKMNYSGLIYQAGDYEMSVTGKDLEYFAELIVRECALVAKTLPHTPERHWVTDSVTYIPVHCEQNILKHFGVKE